MLLAHSAQAVAGFVGGFAVGEKQERQGAAASLRIRNPDFSNFDRSNREPIVESFLSSSTFDIHRLGVGV